MSKVICKNCGKEIYINWDGQWFHEDNISNYCHPEEIAEPEEKCHAYIFVNEVIHECEREYDHGGMHHCELQKNFEIKW